MTKTAPTEPVPAGDGRRWLPTVHLFAVLAFGIVAIVLGADAGVVGVIGVMACAALGWRGPWPTIVIGGRPPTD